MIDIVEPLDEQSVERLQATLGLDDTSAGRLDDDWDYEFGTRVLKGSGIELTEIVLWRADDDPWYVKISYPETQPPTAEELAIWRKEIIDGIKAAGLTPDPSE
jgi:hypothetical protein